MRAEEGVDWAWRGSELGMKEGVNWAWKREWIGQMREWIGHEEVVNWAWRGSGLGMKKVFYLLYAWIDCLLEDRASSDVDHHHTLSCFTGPAKFAAAHWGTRKVSTADYWRAAETECSYQHTCRCYRWCQGGISCHRPSFGIARNWWQGW